MSTIQRSGEELKLLGKATVKVCHGAQEEELNHFVVDGSGPSLLGRDWLAKLKLNWSAIRKLNTQGVELEAILDAHRALFKEELGSITGTKAKLHVDPNAKPRFCTRTCTCNTTTMHAYM